jgi:hypothetical protein
MRNPAVNTRTYALPGRNAGRLVIAIVALAALALSLIYLARPAQANTEPTYVAGNVNSCTDLGLPDGTPSISLDASAVSSGTHTYSTVNGGSIIITANSGLTEFSFNSANPPVLVLAVKAGDGYNVYDYRPDGTTADGGLETPTNGGAQQAVLSHLFICFGEASTASPSESQSADVASIFIRKRDAQYNHLAGAVFTVEGVPGTFTTDANGGVCVTGLPLNATFRVTEITPPPGYELPDPAYQDVHVDNDGDCTSSDVIFVDPPAPTPTPTASESQAATPTPEGSVQEQTSSPSPSESQAESSSPEQSVEAATGTPEPSTPNTSIGGAPGNSGGTILFALLLVGSLATLAVFNVRAARVRR